MHHQWNSSPPSPQSRRFHSRTVDVTWPFSSVLSTCRIGSCQQTSGFQSMKPLARGQGRAVQRASLAAREARSVEEDAGVADEPGAPVAVLLEDREAALLLGDVVELPLLGLEPLRVALHPLVVGVVAEVGAV